MRGPLDEADGLVIYALPASEYEAKQLCKKAKEANREEILIAIPDSIGSLQEAVFEVARLRWIQQNTPELQNDDAARRELSVRLLEAETDVSRQLKAIFDEDNENTCRCYHKGKLKPIGSYQERNEYLSIICKQVYGKHQFFRMNLSIVVKSLVQ